MVQKLTHHDTLSLQKVVTVGGELLLLPEQHPTPYEEYRALQAGDMVAVEQSTLVEMFTDIITIDERYRRERLRTGREPRWIHDKPIQMRTRCRHSYAILCEDPLAILNGFPNTGVSYMIREGGLCQELEWKFNLRRLQGVKQLGFLQAPWLRERLYDLEIGNHNRLVHSYDVMVLATLIGRNVGLPQRQFNTLRMAALTHDMGTPAGGDSVKLVDLPAFDEDLNYERLLNQYDWGEIKTKYRINKKALVETIHNRGLLGQILDIADKLAYVGRDPEACRPFLEYSEAHLDQYGLGTLRNLLARHHNVCGLWDAVDVQDGVMVITDPRRLGVFLKVRTLMFRELYMHPHARFGEYLVSRVLVKALYQEGKLTRDELLAMDDGQLRSRLDLEFAGRHYPGGKSIVENASQGAQCKSFRTRGEAEAFQASLRARGNPFTLLEDNTRLIKTGTHFKVPTRHGPQPFAHAYPGDAQELEEMAMVFPAIHVYYLEQEPSISRAKLAQLVKSMAHAAP